jgi:hypothetical protein
MRRSLLVIPLSCILQRYHFRRVEAKHAFAPWQIPPKSTPVYGLATTERMYSKKETASVSIFAPAPLKPTSFIPKAAAALL